MLPRWVLKKARVLLPEDNMRKDQHISEAALKLVVNLLSGLAALLQILRIPNHGSIGSGCLVGCGVECRLGLLG